LKSDPRFISQPKEFWANVRTISQEVGYTERGTKSIKIPTLLAILKQFEKLGLSAGHIANGDELTDFGKNLFDYFAYRATCLNDTVQGNLMDKAAAEIEFNRLKVQLNPQCPLPMNKQKSEKKNYAFLTGMVNMLIEATSMVFTAIMTLVA
jgi:hypothetical protein